MATVARRYTTTSRATGEAYTIERRAEREGWDFGAVAPLHRVARYFPLGADAPAAPVVALPGRQARKAAALADLYGDVA